MDYFAIQFAVNNAKITDFETLKFRFTAKKR